MGVPTVPKLNPEEWKVFQDLKFMPLKQQVWQKLERILIESAQPFRNLGQLGDFPGLGPKLSRGENYQTYSYRVMDYIRIVQMGDSVLFRLVILWGHPIGIHLILTGSFKELFQHQVLEGYSKLGQDWYAVTYPDPWHWEFDEEYLKPLLELSQDQLKQIWRQQDYLKLSRFYPLTSYDKIPKSVEESWGPIKEVLFKAS